MPLGSVRIEGGKVGRVGAHIRPLLLMLLLVALAVVGGGCSEGWGYLVGGLVPNDYPRVRYDPLYVAIRDGNVERVSRAIRRRPARVNKHMTNSGYPLSAAARHGQMEIARLLLKSGASLEGERSLALQLPVAAGNMEMLRLLVESGGNVNVVHRTHKQKGLLTIAAGKNRIEVAKYLLSVGARPRERAIPAAVSGSSIRVKRTMIRLLLDNGANPDGLNKYGETGLNHAVLAKSSEAAKLLLEGGADANFIFGSYKNTILHIAAQGANVEMVRLFLDAGADPKIRNRAGNTPADEARRCRWKGYEEVVKLLGQQKE